MTIDQPAVGAPLPNDEAIERDDRAVPQPRKDAGVASAEAGVVILDGPDGLAITMTAQAAAQTGQSLIDAAAAAELQPQANHKGEKEKRPGRHHQG